MPVRIYDISKKLGLENKEVLAKAKELGIAARVASSSLDKITAEYLEEKLRLAYPDAAAQAPQAAPAAPTPAPTPAITIVKEPPPAAQAESVISEPPPPAPVAEAAPAPVSPPSPVSPPAPPSEPEPPPEPEMPAGPKVGDKVGFIQL